MQYKGRGTDQDKNRSLTNKNSVRSCYCQNRRMGKTDSEFRKTYSLSSIQHGASEPSDLEVPSVEKALAFTKSIPVQISSMCWSPSLKMIPQITKYEEHGSCLSGIENPKPGENVSSYSRLKQSSVFSDEQPICKDDVLSSIKETLSTANVDSPELSSHYALGSTSKESYNFLRRKRAIFWISSKLAEETSIDDSIGRCIVGEEPEKRPCFSLENPGTLQNVASQQSHFTPHRDQHAKTQSCSFLVKTDKKAGTQSHMLHLKQPLSSENSTGELEIKPFDKREGHFGTQILSLGRDHTSHLSLRQPQQSDDNNHFKWGSEISQEQQKKNALHSPSSGELTKIATLPNIQSDEANSLFLSSSNGIQAIGRQPSLNHEINQAGNNCSLPCDLVRGQTQQGFPHAYHLTQELQFFTDNKTKEHNHQLQHRDSMQSGKEEGFNDHIQEQQIFGQNHHQENRPYLFQHSGQNRSLQSSGQQDIFHPGLSPAVVPTRNGPLLAVPFSSLPGTAMPKLEPHPSHWNGTKNQFHDSWSPPEYLQRPSMKGHDHARSNGEGKLSGSIPQWDGLPQSTYGILNHDQYENLKNFIGCFTSNNGHSKDDWVRLQHSHANFPYGYPHKTCSTNRAGHIPCINIFSASYPNSQIVHFRQQSSGLQNINGQRPSLRSPRNL